MKGALIAVIVLVVIIVIGVFTLKGDKAQPGNTTDEVVERQEVLDQAPSFALKDYNGNVVTSRDFDGKSLVINSWAAWCPFCVDELPDFAQIQEEFADDVVFIAINRRESLETAKGFTDSLGLSDSMVFLLDPDDSFYRSIGGFSMPETILVTENAGIQFHKRGPMDLDETRSRVQSLIES